MRQTFIISFFSVVWVLIGISCASINNAPVKTLLEKDNCNLQQSYAYPVSDLPLPFYERTTDSLMSLRFSQSSLHIAHAIGVLSMLDTLVASEEAYFRSPDTDHLIRLIHIRQQLVNRVQIASLEISAVASELDCEKERADQVADYLSRKENERESKLTVAAITTGATVAVASGILLSNDNDRAVEYLGIVGGITEVVIGLMILTSNPEVPFQHERNPLKEIWTGQETSSVFPPFIWYYLNYFDPRQPESPSLRVQLLESWAAIGGWDLLGQKKKRKLMELYFGSGGNYTSGHLRQRVRMLNQLEAYVTLMKQEITKLAVELEQPKK